MYINAPFYAFPPLYTLTVLGALALLFFIKLAYLIVQSRLLRLPAHIAPGPPVPTSVIIAARNEEENLQQLLPLVFAQNHPDFQVVVINDRSTDGTEFVLKAFATHHSNLKVVNITQPAGNTAGKKFAVSLGIKAADNDWLVFTDADCLPASDNWLSTMQPAVREHNILLGYSPYTAARGLLNALIRYEGFFTAINYMSFALAGQPYMGVGRNLAYNKALFFAGKGFAKHMHIKSGDDDLFVNQNATAGNTGIIINSNSFVYSHPPSSFSAYRRQKHRHIGAGSHYKFRHKFLLSLQVLTNILFYIFCIAGMLSYYTMVVVCALNLMLVILKYIIYAPLIRRFAHSDLARYVPFLDFLLYLFLAYNYIYSLFNKKVVWK